MELEYADGDRLYVPMDQVHLIQKYVAFGARAPRLHKLGGVAWTNAKVRAYASALTYARTLLDIQAKRVALPGFAFAPDTEWQRSFDAAFPYRETPDQATAIADVKRDMEEARPMDRVLLGDVGYGKTEIAIRAAFKGVMAHKQVAVLVPTTILAYQHYRTFSRRMEGFPIRVEMLSRFQPERAQRQIAGDLASGSCDIVIGTHRLLSSDVRFKDLGLLVIDEEQRFGVKDKERIKEWRTQLDVLVLSATPIPRTLYLSLVGARDMSLIATAPEHRHPIDTQVVEEDDASIGRWIRRELARKGQVYVVHNRVRSIHAAVRRIQELVPQARVAAAHGQMDEQELEQVMVAFMEARVDVLVTTTIIESGIDIPNANTLVVFRADAFGLADLYQLRGRVGRFDRRAYAYLVVPSHAVLSADARQRLDAMTQHTALGSGFKVAMEDLKIRGAGNLLGVEQSGHISAVGFDLYCRLLREAVDKMKQEGANMGKGHEQTQAAR
jgi:transcription-repair coupling factor (superfamily II helicase)